jgi:hypothetical protein
MYRDDQVPNGLITGNRTRNFTSLFSDSDITQLAQTMSTHISDIISILNVLFSNLKSSLPNKV